MDLDDRTAWLSSHPIFSRLAPDALARLAALMTGHPVTADETVFAVGDPAECMYVVVSGTVTISLISPRGREQVLNVMRPNDVFGELALIRPGVRTARAVADGDCVLLSLARERFDELVREQPGFAAELSTILLDRVRALQGSGANSPATAVKPRSIVWSEE